MVDVVRKNQPQALVSGRVGYDLGDYQTLGDMEVPLENVDGKALLTGPEIDHSLGCGG